jgi:hypothetical protein
VDTIFKFLHSIMFTLTLQISKLTKAVVLNSFPHGRLNAKYINTSDWNSFGINIGGWAGDYNIRSTNFCRITTCNERCINRVHLTFSVYTNLLCWYIFAMRSCNERTTIYCVESYLYYILVNKKIFSEEWNEGEKK